MSIKVFELYNFFFYRIQFLRTFSMRCLDEDILNTFSLYWILLVFLFSKILFLIEKCCLVNQYYRLLRLCFSRADNQCDRSEYMTKKELTRLMKTLSPSRFKSAMSDVEGGSVQQPQKYNCFVNALLTEYFLK